MTPPGLGSRFRSLWDRTLGIGRPEDVFALLDQAYASPARAYHSWRHIAALLQDLDAVRAVPEFGDAAFDEVELAIFFHDAVYDPSRTDNEARSAALFRDAATGSSGSAPASVGRVSALIEATAGHGASRDPSTRLLLDLDLGILAAPPASYRSYVAGVRREFSHVPDALWARGRAAFLDRLLARDRIFQTSHFHHRLEDAARANLAAERQELARIQLGQMG